MMKIAAFFGRLVFFALSFGPVTYVGEKASRKEAPILVVAPHSSFFDAFIPLVLGLVSVVGQAAAAQGIFGSLALLSQPVLVDRDDKDSRKKALRDISDRCNLDKPWPQLLLFPEGTCSNRTALFKFKIGAFLPGQPVQPVCVHWPGNFVSLTRFTAHVLPPQDTTTWTWSGPNMLTLLWMTMCQFNTRIILEFLPVYRPSNQEMLDPELYANNVRDKMAEALAVPTTEFSFQCVRLVTLALKCKLPMALSVVDLLQLNKLLAEVYPSATNGPEAFVRHYDDCRLASSQDMSAQKALRLAKFTHFARNQPTIEWFEEIPEFASLMEKHERLLEGIAQCYLMPNSDMTVDTRKLACHMNILFHFGDVRTRFLKAMEVYKNIADHFAPANPASHGYTCDPIPGYAISRSDAKHFVQAISTNSMAKDTKSILDIVQTCIQRGNGHILSTDLYEVIREKYPKLIKSYVKYLSDTHNHATVPDNKTEEVDKRAKSD
ncbi:Lysophosphatidylcholine acyltransferase 2 [Cichlidogyrus casuarinus]|uniref:Lysophosphatidylcholine acyltransferase 2 n=1 Tax=Cichlidogyrus casuarinus TaxID=1844966 RepID=A0ABD2Q1W5_9PLAT